MEGFTHVTKKNNGSEEIFLGCPNIPEMSELPRSNSNSFIQLVCHLWCLLVDKYNTKDV